MTGTSTAEIINFNEPIGVFSSTKEVRLDIGTRAVKENVPADHNSWATRLVVKRVDGPSEGPVHTDHVIGLFSETEAVRLDIGTRAMKENVPADHDSWATQLNIREVAPL